MENSFLSHIPPDVRDEINNSLRYRDDLNDLMLRGHLLSEQYIIRLLRILLPKPNRLLGKRSRLSYKAKLDLLHSYDVLPMHVYCGLGKLNEIRNNFAHDLDYRITFNDCMAIAQALDGDIVEYIRKYKDPPTGLSVTAILLYLLGELALVIKEFEDRSTTP